MQARALLLERAGRAVITQAAKSQNPLSSAHFFKTFGSPSSVSNPLGRPTPHLKSCRPMRFCLSVQGVWSVETWPMVPAAIACRT